MCYTIICCLTYMFGILFHRIWWSISRKVVSLPAFMVVSPAFFPDQWGLTTERLLLLWWVDPERWVNTMPSMMDGSSKLYMPMSCLWLLRPIQKGRSINNAQFYHRLLVIYLQSYVILYCDLAWLRCVAWNMCWYGIDICCCKMCNRLSVQRLVDVKACWCKNWLMCCKLRKTHFKWPRKNMSDCTLTCCKTLQGSAELWEKRKRRKEEPRKRGWVLRHSFAKL